MSDVVALLFIVCLVVSVINNRNKIINNPLEKNLTKSLRGVLSVIVVLFHLSQHTTEGILFRLFGQMGYLAVASFFLMSGYGLLYQLRKMGGGYLNDFFGAYAGRLINSKILHSKILYTFFGLLASTAFSLLIVVISQRITIENCMWDFIGSISMELYLIHELIYVVLRSKKIYITSDGLYIVITLIVSIVLAWLLHIIFRKITITSKHKDNRDKRYSK